MISLGTSVHSGTLRHVKRRPKKLAAFRRKRKIARYVVVVVVGWFAVNWLYQVMRKPVELFAPANASLSKSPEITWQSYGALFEKYSTGILAPEFLAALAQLEGAGNPVATTYWRWQWSWNPFEVYRPASSAVGMFQITDGTFAEARKYCIRDHKVLTEPGSCWFNGFYIRTLPSHATELTAAYLHQSVVNTLAARHSAKVSSSQKQKLAAVIHLCGSRRGEAFAKRGFRSTPEELCGDHSVQRYLAQIDLLKKRFARLRAGIKP